MTAARFILRSLLHYRFAYLGVLAGAVLGATVLLGALFAGDSVKKSLQQIGANRTGQATHLLVGGDRFFREELAADLATAAQVRVAPVLLARGTAAPASGQSVVNQVQLIGVTGVFWEFAPTPTTVALDAAKSAVAVNATLARRLGIKIGDTLIVRLQKPGIVAGNAPVAGAESTLQAIRGTVAAVVDDPSFGRFSLDTTQVPSPSVFLPIAMLQESLEQTGRANVLLIDAAKFPADLNRVVENTVRLPDYGLALKWNEIAAAFAVTSNRVFLDPELANAISTSLPAAQPVLSYLVNEFRVGDKATPYSIATATTAVAAPFLPANLGARDIVLNDWLADDLAARVGDEVTLKYFQTGAGGALVEQSATFRVHSVVPLAGLAADSAWMPDFPGISDVDSPGDWDPGLPLDLSRIRGQDDRYWENYRGAPKAFLSIEAGREIWSTRWGSYTALRIPYPREREAELADTILRALRPGMNQLHLRDFRANAEEAARSPVDFGGLFVGMSFFLIIAALGLVAMLLQFSLLQRNREDALLGAVGLPARQLLRWRLSEGFVILLVGCALGLPLAALYTRGILKYLESIWAGQGAGETFLFAAQPVSMAAGAGAFLLLSMLAIWWAIRKQTRSTLSIRLASQAEEITPPAKVRRSSRIILIVTLVMGVGALALSGRGLPAQGAFYLAGFALLAAGIALCRGWMATSAPVDREAPLDARYLGGLNVKARRSRSLTVVGLIATAVFMVLSVSSFRKSVGDEWRERNSGTGGFSFWVETTAALNPARDGRSGGFELFEAQAAQLGDIVPLRAGVGDNVNCFNLNTTSQPQLLAVDSAQLAALGAFRLKIAAHADSADSDGPGWNVLRDAKANGAIPAVVDENTLLWALKRKVGDVLIYMDESGRPFEIQIVGTLPDSILQGYLIVDERLFLEKFPSNAGYSRFLVDARESSELPALRNRLETSSRDVGGRVEITRDVLAAFHQIENTYIAIFTVLGSLGVVLGSLGLAIVVARNLRERRGEFAVMTAIGIPRSVLGRMVFSEFGRLVWWGIAIGTVASAIAVWPSATSLPAGPTLVLVFGLLAGIVALNLVSGWAVFRWSLRDLRPGMQ